MSYDELAALLERIESPADDACEITLRQNLVWDVFPGVALDLLKAHDIRRSAEAEDLRRGIEGLLRDADDAVLAVDVQRILDEVDARDSLAYLEAVTPSADDSDLAEILERIQKLEKRIESEKRQFRCHRCSAVITDDFGVVLRGARLTVAGLQCFPSCPAHLEER